VFDLPSSLAKQASFEKIKTWTKTAPEPCRSCVYLDICKGGCHAVSEYVTGNFDNPDPDCPFVVEYKKKGTFND
jgi:radical SAM protein with 4Fe4S-binding SPASM domain